MEKRRQNVSCEQCRRSKKACDGFFINVSQRNSVETTSPSVKTQGDAILPCSYCSRTNKHCSLHPHWDKAHLADIREQSCTSDESPRTTLVSRKRQRRQDSKAASPGASDFPAVPPSSESVPTRPFLPTPSQHCDPFTLDDSLDLSLAPGAAYLGDFANASITGDHPAVPGASGWATIPALHPVHDEQQLHASSNMGFPFDTPCVDPGTLPPALDTQGALIGHPHPPMGAAPRLSMASSTSTQLRKTRPREDDDEWLDSFSNPNSLSNHNSLSPFGITNSVASASNRTLISESLLRIYHDVLENNLCCWVAEDTCPYKVEDRTRQLTRLSYMPGEAAENGLEWGQIWSNRMYRRVKKLDRVARSSGLIRMTRSESSAASKALDLTIMAFATQWSQGSRRKEQFGGNSFGGGGGGGSNDEDDDGVFGDDHFEQILQQSIWEQAKKALNEVAELECFRVIYAELVFGLIQKPWACYDHPDPDEINGGDGDQFGSIRGWVLPQLLDILREGGPPLVLERAARKIHALKSRLELREMRSHNETLESFSTDDRRTVGLLYWLAVMFDTVSSAMNERPVVVSDDECRHDDQSYELVPSRRWELDLYAQEHSKNPSPLHWPCPFESATLALSRSAAVKVLFWRYVSYLQSSLRKRESPEAVEETIAAALSVYQYWNKTHGAFFRDLTENFDTVPARIKSWYPCIEIPWLLASMTLVDLIEFVDEHRLGLETSRAQRADAGLVPRIRRSSATELAELAGVTAPQDSKPVMTEQLPDFHFAVSESSLLTEPWTVLLIRAFTKAALFHLTEAESLQQHGWSGMADAQVDIQRSVSHGETCTRVLWFLGSKSEMARGVARVLARSLRRFDNNPVRTDEPSQQPTWRFPLWT